MKKIFLTALIAQLLFTSCTNDEFTETSDVNNAAISYSAAKEGANISNTNNPYDYVGSIFMDVNSVLMPNPNSSLSVIIENVDSTAALNSSFDGINEGYTGIQQQSLQWLITNNRTDVIENLNVTPLAKDKLSEFVQYLDTFSGINYEAINAIIKDFEADIINSPEDYTVNDLRVILCSTSIARYTFYNGGYDKFNKHRTHVLGAMTGAQESAAMAITMACAAGLAE